jgi:hypothetical protein
MTDIPLPSSFTRQALYDLVWSEPVQSLAKKLSISDRGLAKVCVAANIPVPARGYWAKLQAGKPATKFPLPPRAVGQWDNVSVRVDRWGYARETNADILKEVIPPAPVFTPDMETVAAQAAAMVRRAPVPLRDSHGWHSQIQKLLDADEERARKQAADRYPSSWNAPIFRTPFEMRRLRILNALFTRLTRCGMKPGISGKEGRGLSVTVGTSDVSFKLDSISAAKHLEREKAGYGFTARGDKDRMRLDVDRWWKSTAPLPSWEDKPGDKLERQLREIAAALIVFAEQSLREHEASSHAWRIERKEKALEAERQRIAEEERKRAERKAKMEQARIDHLLGQARALHQAEQIRAYVRAVEMLDAQMPNPMTAEGFEAWSTWALREADRIDPVRSGAYRTRPIETD